MFAKQMSTDVDCISNEDWAIKETGMKHTVVELQPARETLPH